MLCGDFAVMQAPGFDSLSFDSVSLFQDGLSPSEVDIGRGQIIDALVIAVVVVVIHEGFNAGLKISGEEVVFQQDAVSVLENSLHFGSTLDDSDKGTGKGHPQVL